MVFSSLLFIFVFLPIALVFFYITTFATRFNKSISYSVLTGLSLAFYFWGSGQMILLLIASILFNWVVGKKLVQYHSDMKRKSLLIIAIVINLSALFYFKYCRFFLDTLGIFTGGTLAPSLNPYLPVGISFYTFMTISYLIEVYRSSRHQASLLEFATYLSLFPHLVAGPIVRFGEVATDLRQKHSLSVNDFFTGIVRFTQGLGMKVLIADNLSPTVDRIFALDPSALTCAVSWLGACAYTFQIYFDFAGYSAMAIGLALMFGLHFPENFNRPYIAASITEFWQRWHISLSRWLRDYLYIPLGGNRKGNVRTYFNLFAVFFVCGLWHGAAWTFVVWGLYQGTLLILERVMKNNLNYEPSGVMGVMITFFLTVVGWVVFRSESFGQCWYFLGSMFSFHNALFLTDSSAQLSEFIDPLVTVSLAAATLFSFCPFEKMINKIQPDGIVLVFLKTMITSAVLILATLYAVGSSFQPFIYFRF